MTCPAEYWIWLQRTLGVGKRCDEIIAYFGNPQNLYESGKKAWLESGIISIKNAENLTKFSPSQSYDVMKQCLDNGWSIVPYDDERYPDSLKEISAFPLVLYVRGDAKILSYPVKIGIVGTRNVSDYGYDVAESFSYSLSKAGAVIVSGGAIGVDSAAHFGSLKAGGKTIAFLGCGLGSKYLASNEHLRERIAGNGAVVSEFPPMTEPTRTTFPIRNRLISGISLGTLVVEAGEKSGSLITARFAAEQGRDIFAVPGNITNSNFLGTNQLIRNGAKTVFSYRDILTEYVDRYGKYINLDIEEKPVIIRKNAVKSAQPTAKKKIIKEEIKTAQKPELPSYASDNAKKVYGILTCEAMIIDDIITLAKLPVKDVISSLTELELYGVVELHSGKRYSLKQTAT